jgi:type IX secretion system PorP/SprF family membrane protein
MKKIYYLFLCFCFLVPVVQAQQKPPFNQYLLNAYLINPALTGVENYADVKTSYRSQWSGLDGAPVTFYLTAHSPLGKKDRSSSTISLPAKSKNAIIQELRFKEENDFKPLYAHHGMGGMVIADKIGPFKRLGTQLSYAYHQPVFQDKMKFSAGISAGFTRYSIDFARLNFGPDTDPVVLQYRQADLLPELGLGLNLYGKNYYLGASAAQLFQNTLSGDKKDLYRFRNQYFLMGGYEYRYNQEVALVPSLLVKWMQPSAVSVDLNLKVSYLRKIWGGLSYRRQNAVAILAGCNLKSLVNVGYAYELSDSRLQNQHNGSHELLLGFIFNNRYRIHNPSDFNW